MKKAMVIGLEPEYNYPGNFDIWMTQNTKYASNHGASLISKSILKMFNADFIDATVEQNIDKLRQDYDLCIIAFSTHATSWRDVSIYGDFVVKLDLPTSIFSIGVQDYSPDEKSVKDFHPSLKIILEHVKKTTGLIGVRGPYSKKLFEKNGYNNIEAVGCPTLFSTLNRNFKVQNLLELPNNIGLVYHRTVCDLPIIQGHNVEIIGQDFLDEVVFKKNPLDNKLNDYELPKYKDHKHSDEYINKIKKSGFFVKNFNDWHDKISSKDFIYGPRLHGCIGGILQNIPSLLLTRDLRTREIAEFYQMPSVDYSQFKSADLKEMVSKSDFSAFNDLYSYRYDNFISFLKNTGAIKHFNG